MLQARHPQLSTMCSQLAAVKWLGNTGSHGEDVVGGILEDTVCNAFDIMEHVLGERFQNPHSYINKICQQINKQKGPR
jgi:hypothetical protein